MSMSGHLGDLLSALLDGELEYAEAAAARAHLQGCPFCRAELDATATTRALVRALPTVEMPPGLIDDVLGWGAPIVSIGAARRASRMRPLTAVAGVAARLSAGGSLFVHPGLPLLRLPGLHPRRKATLTREWATRGVPEFLSVGTRTAARFP